MVVAQFFSAFLYMFFPFLGLEIFNDGVQSLIGCGIYYKTILFVPDCRLKIGNSFLKIFSNPFLLTIVKTEVPKLVFHPFNHPIKIQFDFHRLLSRKR